MRKLIQALLDRITAPFPPQLRTLHQQFLLRVVDLEALSIEADIPGFLGQFAGILIMLSIVHGLGVLWFPPPPSMAWSYQQSRISDMLLVIGLCTILMWDTTFPDKRDVMVLSPLPISPRIILMAKIAASATVLGIAVIALNCASSVGQSVVFGAPAGGLPGMARFFLAYWFTMFAAAAFLYSAILTIQGFTALVLPRRAFLTVSAIMQLAAFGIFLGVRFLQPSLPSHADLINPANHWLLLASPTFWFLAILNHLNGTLPADLLWLAHRAWICLALSTAGAAASLLLCYVRTMKKTVEDPDLVPGSRAFQWMPTFGSSLQNAIVIFCLRSIARSRQHRLALAFYWSVVFAIALSWIRREASGPPEPIAFDFILSSFLMMSFGVLGLRAIFSLPISLNANWILRITQLRPTHHYIAATRRALLLLGVVPIWIICATLSLHLRPASQTIQHLAFLALLGCILVEFSLIRFEKVPFTCSYLPGKANVQAVFWGFAFTLLSLGLLIGTFELGALRNPLHYALMMLCAAGIIAALWAINRLHARSAVLYFEELPPEVITRLGLLFVPPAQIADPSRSGPL
jgi:cytochrome c oxidase subunit IV